MKLTSNILFGAIFLALIISLGAYKVSTTEKQGRVKRGDIAPELTAVDPQNNERSLSDLRGKIVLIDFWASWCGPCRVDNPRIVKLYNKYHDVKLGEADGFEIFSYSLDYKKKNWLAAIEKDGLIWDNHVSELKGWGSSAVDIYNVRGIPNKVVIDENGKVLYTNISASELAALLDQLSSSK